MKPFIGVIAQSAVSIFVVAMGLYLAFAESPTVSQSNVADQVLMETAKFAADERRPVVDAKHPLYSAIGKFKGTMRCTASIVLHPRIIVTAGHCITKKDGTLKVSDLFFEPGYRAGAVLGQFKATLWAVGSKQNFRQESIHEASQDWAILVLDRTPADVQPFLMRHQTFEELKSIGRQMLMPSYSIDIADAEKLGLDPACSLLNMIWDALVHDCKASFGSSGAPLLVHDRLGYAIVGIHTGSMYASDSEGHIGKFVGNRAISSEMFMEELLTLSQRLRTNSLHEVAAKTYQRPL